MIWYYVVIGQMASYYYIYLRVLFDEHFRKRSSLYSQLFYSVHDYIIANLQEVMKSNQISGFKTVTRGNSTLATALIVIFCTEK